MTINFQALSLKAPKNWATMSGLRPWPDLAGAVMEVDSQKVPVHRDVSTPQEPPACRLSTKKWKKAIMAYGARKTNPTWFPNSVWEPGRVRETKSSNWEY